MEQIDVQQQNKAYQVLTVDFEPCLTLACDKTLREYPPLENAENNQGCQHSINNKYTPRPEVFISFKQVKAEEQSQTFHVAGTYPQLIGIEIIIGKNRHAFVSQGMEQIDGADEEVSDTDEEEIRIFYVLLGMPGNHEEGVRHDNAEKFSQDMKYQIVETGGDKQAEKQKAQE